MAARQILLEFYHALGGEEWLDDSNWNSNKPLNAWYGVTVNENDRLLEIDLENNNLVGTLPDCIGNASSLVRLNLRGNKISGPLPASLGQCSNLKGLGLSRNLITGSIPEALGKCSKLEYIGLSNNRLIDTIPDSLGRCTRLREVSLGSNKLIGTIPETFGNCTKLATLSLMNNNMSGEIPKCIEKMVGLQKLLLDKNSFTGMLSPKLSNLVKLRQLSLADNDLQGVFPESLRNCSNLKKLNLSGNDFSGSVDEGIGACTSLESLHVKGTKLTHFEGLRHLKKLKFLDIKLSDVLEDFPPELRDKDVQFILSYVRELFLTSKEPDAEEDQSVITVKRAKLVFIGPGEAGKSTLIHRLREGKYDGGLGITDGIQISDWVIDELRMSCWDFSGQGVYMNTHNLFFSERAIFILVWNPRQHENLASLNLFFYTIRNVSPKAPIILVSTHAKDTSKASDGLLDMFNERFGSPAGLGKISCYHHIDSATGVGIQELKTDICKVALRQKFVTKKIPKIYKKFEGGLKDMAKHGRFSLTSREIRKFAFDYHKLDDLGCDAALDLFHDWGFVHVMPGGEVVLEPQKLADVFACAISHKAEKIYSMGDGKLGLLRHDEIDLVWKNFDSELQSHFLQLIHDNKLAYPLYDSHGVSLEASIVPAMLPDEPLGTDSISSELQLRELFFPENAAMQASVRLQFDFLPVDLIPSLQVRLFGLATLGGAWKHGCALQLESFCRASEKTMSHSYAIVNAIPSENCIDIISGGDTTAARSVVIRSLIAIRDANYKGLEFVDVKVTFNSEPVASRKLIERKLRKDPNAVVVYEGDDKDVAVPLRGLQFLLKNEPEDPDKDFRKKKTRLIHEELVSMHFFPNNDAGDNSKLLRDSNSGGSSLMETLKKQLDKIHAAEAAAIEEGKKPKKPEIIDFRQVTPQSILDLETAVKRADENPEELDEFLDLEKALINAIDDILLFGCNVPPKLSGVHTLWVSYGDGTKMLPLSPPEKPTQAWDVVADARMPIIPRGSRSNMPHINKDISDTVLRAMQVLGIECPAPPPEVVEQLEGTDNSKVVKITATHTSAEFAPSVKWFGLVDLSHCVEEVRNVQDKHFEAVVNQEVQKVYIAKKIAARMQAPNMVISDQVFRKLFQGLRGQGNNPHISLLRTAIDTITPMSVTISPRYDLFLSHTGRSEDVKVAKMIASFFTSKGLVVWMDPKRKTGINKLHMTSIDNSSLFVMCISSVYLDVFSRAESNEAKKAEGKLGVKACDDTCYLQYNYARKRKNSARLIPFLVAGDVFKSKDVEDPLVNENINFESLVGPMGRMVSSYFCQEEENQKDEKVKQEEKSAEEAVADIAVTGGRISRKPKIEAKAKNPIKETPEFETRDRSDLLFLTEFQSNEERLHAQLESCMRKLLGCIIEPLGLTGAISQPHPASIEKESSVPPGAETLDREHSCFSFFDGDEIYEVLLQAFNAVQADGARQEARAREKHKRVHKKLLKDLTVEELSLVLANLRFSNQCKTFRDKEVSGMTLCCVDSIDELIELGVKTKVKARELLHHIKSFKVGGVPLTLIQLPPSIQEKLAQEEAEKQKRTEEEAKAEKAREEEAAKAASAAKRSRKSMRQRRKDSTH